MDDRELRQAFEEYVDGVDAPPASVTEKAKNQIIKDGSRSRLVKRITAAAACVACACLVTVGAVLLPIITVGDNKAGSSTDMGGITSPGNRPSDSDTNSDPSNPSAPDAPDGDHSGSGQGGGYADGEVGGGYGEPDANDDWVTYPQSALTQRQLDADGDLPAGLEFVKTAKAGFGVTYLTGNYQGEALRYAQAEVTHTAEGVTGVATVYAEFTEWGFTCDIFTEYLDGERYTHKGVDCIISEGVRDGKSVTKLFFEGENARYYLIVDSPDDCPLYLDLILDK